LGASQAFFVPKADRGPMPSPRPSCHPPAVTKTGLPLARARQAIFVFCLHPSPRADFSLYFSALRVKVASDVCSPAFTLPSRPHAAPKRGVNRSEPG
jgi:hypothetical protein